MLILLQAALANAPLAPGGGGPSNVSLKAGFGADLDRVRLPTQSVRRTTHQTLNAQVDAVLLPALALSVEAAGAVSNQDLGWLVTDRVQAASSETVAPIPFNARDLSGSLFVGVGPQLGNDQLELQLAIGPSVGSSGLSPDTYRRLVEDHQLQPDPTPYELGLRSRVRGRWTVAERFAVETRGGAEVLRIFRPDRHFLPSRRSEGAAGSLDDTTAVRLASTLEGQVLLVPHLWLTLGGSLHNQLAYRKLDGAGTVSSWNHAAQGQLGVRWR